VVQAGDFYVFFNAVWYMNTFWEAVPADYTPSARTPLEDFVSKVRLGKAAGALRGRTRLASWADAPADGRAEARSQSPRS